MTAARVEDEDANTKACKATAAIVIVALCACLLHGLNRIYAGEIGGGNRREIGGKSGCVSGKSPLMSVAKPFVSLYGSAREPTPSPPYIILLKGTHEEPVFVSHRVR